MPKLNTFSQDISPRVFREKGFTLIEVIIALAVIAISMGAVINGVGKNIKNASYLREKTLAHWVASNKVAEIQLSGIALDASEKKGEETLAELRWEWTVKISNTDIEAIKRLTVEVKREDANTALATVIAYVGQES
ncbi:MAG: type II secretion system minor pseudopilin GspI [Gammaproteobacteria bacterium]|nr:type II secretion system minor pseudopilin GspI [Gammaproteobacteria bacterium]